MAKLEENYPDFATQVLEGIEAVEEHHSINEDSQFLEKRQHFNKCFNQPQSASTAPIDQGIKYLRGVPGRPVLGPGNGPGKGRCVIPSCSYKSAILWCNDVSSLDSNTSQGLLIMQNTHTVRLDSYDAIANAARVITNACTRVYSGQSVTNGQRFHGNKQNVVVRGQDCPN